MKKASLIVLIILALFPLDSLSQISNPTQSQRKIALVIGNGNYQSSILANPENDARAMRDALQNVGFTVLEYENLDQIQMKKAMDDFGAILKSFEVGLFYYAGHGIQSKGYNYLIPIDAQLQSEQQIEYDCVQADRILALMEASGSKVNIIILDACRNNPFERSWTRSTTGKGLAFMSAPKGTLIAYATSPGSTASDGSGRNGLYTSAILESIRIPDITIIQMFQQVRSIVSQKSYDKQTPWESTSLTGDFYFNIKEIVSAEIRENIQVSPLNESTPPDGIDYIIDSRDNQWYKTVMLGDNVWMAENLKATKYNDGTDVPLVTNVAGWARLSTPGYCWYNNDEAANKATYGVLYNWYAVNTKVLCPTGWHVPTDVDWLTLANYFGGYTIVGGKLKETNRAHWSSPNTGATNETDFTALPGGYRDLDGKFSKIGFSGSWWSSSECNLGYAWFRSMNSISSHLLRGYYSKKIGLSVRCVRD